MGKRLFGAATLAIASMAIACSRVSHFDSAQGDTLGALPHDRVILSGGAMSLAAP